MLVHIDWDSLDNSYYHMHIPIWENYFLFFMGLVSGMPEFEKYHYTNFERSLIRGIGICGDASMVLSQILDSQNIDNKIVSFPGHVVVESSMNNGKSMLYDADFGVVVPYSPEEVNANPDIIYQYYSQKGYSDKEIKVLLDAYSKAPERWNGVSHFMTKKYYFEIVTYWLKWPLPVIMIITGYAVLRRNGRAIK